MANVEEVSTWRDCLEAISRIQKDYNDDLNGVWFRGHASANWNLTTTLERRVQQRVSFTDYYNKTIRRIKPAIDSYTDAAWEMPPPKKIESWAKDYEKGSRKQIHCYDYLAHLRHNGFPSPLLDWTRSPYVAAYFAFARPENEKVAIYAYSEQPKNVKTTSRSHPEIRALGPYVRTHKRHFRQQSRYTMCAAFDSEEGWVFESHEEIFKKNRTDQDFVRKITIPTSERTEVLTALSYANVNAFSLFESQESLMEMLAIEEIDLRLAAKKGF